MKTSQAGKLINEARTKIQARRYKDAINVLIDSLKENPTSQEVAEAHYLIGQSYLYLKSYDESRDYFMQAMRHEMFRYPARLGIAEIYYIQDERIKALQVLTEVLVSAKRADVRSSAGKLFQQISPFKSVLYVMTQPEGATVIVNDKTVAVKTPILLHDLMVGIYRLHFHLPGFESHMIKIDLGVSEFKPMVVKLQPVKPVE
jgi:tetratricopeptide (TPR) repeat protein